MMEEHCFEKLRTKSLSTWIFSPHIWLGTWNRGSLDLTTQ